MAGYEYDVQILHFVIIIELIWLQIDEQMQYLTTYFVWQVIARNLTRCSAS